MIYGVSVDIDAGTTGGDQASDAMSGRWSTIPVQKVVAACVIALGLIFGTQSEEHAKKSHDDGRHRLGRWTWVN
jgi:hypothetical protein